MLKQVLVPQIHYAHYTNHYKKYVYFKFILLCKLKFKYIFFTYTCNDFIIYAL